MGRHALVPPALRAGPFTIEQAEAAGVSARALRRSPAWRRVEHGVYIWAKLPLTQYERLLVISWRLPDGAVFSGLAAAWLHGVDVSVGRPEVIVPPATGLGALAGVTVHRTELDRSEVTLRRGLPVTSATRVIGDVARRLPLADAVAVADSVLHRGLTDQGQLESWLVGRLTHKWVARARRVIALSDGGAESPMETALRVLLVTSGLPKPDVQAELRGAEGDLLGRVDLYYPEARLVVEYDGEVHRGAMLADDRRQNQLIAGGYRILRFNAADLRDRRREVVASVRAMLRERAFVDESPQLRAS